MDLDIVMTVLEYAAKIFSFLQGAMNDYVLKNIPGILEWIIDKVGGIDLSGIGDSISGLFG